MTVFFALYLCLLFLISSYANLSSNDDYADFRKITHTLETEIDNTEAIENDVIPQRLRDECCNRNDYDSLCTREKCYFVIENESSWLTSRMLCSKGYVRWERLADIATFQNRAEFEEVLSLLRKKNKLWIGGIKCPEKDLIYNETWINGKSIRSWINATNSDVSNSCTFLTTNANEPDDHSKFTVSFRFENETKNYKTLCELKVGKTGTTNQTNTTLSTTRSRSSSSTSTTLSTTRPRSSPSTSTMPLDCSTADTSVGRCKERFYKDILWPSTPGGEYANTKCPNGTIGTATWKCDKKTNEFISEPDMMGCVSEWFKDIEDAINDDKDPTDIANKLAEKTEEKELRFGDLPGIINFLKELINVKFTYAYDRKKSKQFGKAAVKTGSNLLKLRTKSSWNQLSKDKRLKTASSLLEQIQTIGKMVSCEDEEHPVDITSDNILLQIYSFRSEDNHIFPRLNDAINGTYILVPSGLKLLDSSAATCSKIPTGYGVLYNGIGSHLSDQDTPNSDKQVNSRIISFAYGDGDRSIPLPTGKEVLISLKHIEASKNDSRCVFWNFTTLQWDNTGCEKIDGNETHTICKCSHLTNFAVLMDFSGEGRKSNDPVKKYLSIVCCGLSSLALIFTISCLIGFRASHSRRSTITCNLAFCLLMVNLLMLFGVNRTEIEVVCRIISGALHYTALASFFWMLLEGYHLYQMVIVVFERANAIKIRWFCLSAYGVPLLIVLPTILASPRSYTESEVCWLSARDNMIWVFAGPVALIIVINTTILILALRSASNVKMKIQKTKAKNVMGWLKGSFSLMSLLGITWTIGFINIYKDIAVLNYIFIILNGLQGCFIMIFHVLINEKVRGCFVAFITRSQFTGKGFRNSLQTTSSRNPLQSQRRSESSKGSPMHFSYPRRISVSPISTTYTGHM